MSLCRKACANGATGCSNEDIARCHREDLIYEIESLCRRDASFIDADTRISPESFEVARLAAGAALSAVDAAMREEGGRAFALIRPPGHHATISAAMGFCLFNNAAIGARYAQSRYGVERVLIIDWDVHHGNGTQEIFWTDPTVFYFSTHQYPYYPGTGPLANEAGGTVKGTRQHSAAGRHQRATSSTGVPGRAAPHRTNIRARPDHHFRRIRFSPGGSSGRTDARRFRFL